MGTTNELIRQLHDRKLGAVEQMRALVRKAETRQNGKFSGEDEQSFQRVTADIDALTERIDNN